MPKLSVKESQNGGWGLTQGFKKGRTYRKLIKPHLDTFL